jgi:alpha-tubulin suppressor-like RCC1 family protein
MRPATVLLPSPAVEIAAGREHSCAVTNDGAVYCWGDGTNGQRGDGDWGLALTPQAVTLL